MSNGDFHSGHKWDDLYDHLYDKGHEISKEKVGYTGWIVLATITHLKEGKDDAIDVFLIDGNGGVDRGRRNFRKKGKLKRMRRDLSLFVLISLHLASDLQLGGCR